jgi:hypothetical protein
VTITATFETIDYDKRTVDLKGPRGNVVTLKVGPEAKNFKQIKTGDHVTAKYYRATAISCASLTSRPSSREEALFRLPLRDKSRAVSWSVS